MKHRLLVSALLALLLASSAFAATPNAAHRPQKGLGCEQFTPLVSTALTLPAGAKHVTFTIRDGDVYWTTDGTAASDANGAWLPWSFSMTTENDPEYIAAFRFIVADPATPAKVYACYSGNR